MDEPAEHPSEKPDQPAQPEPNGGQGAPAPSRRRFLKYGLISAGVLAAAGAGVGGYAYWLKTLPNYTPPKERIPPPSIDDEIRIVAIGDWGSGNRRQAQVAAAIEKHAAKIGGFHCGLLLGDNFYFDGISGVDDPTWRRLFEEVYDTPHLGLMPWHAILGNHDYRGDEEAQIAYTKTQKVKRWNMPGHYYRVDLGWGRDGFGEVCDAARVAASGTLLTLLAIDTNDEFRKQDLAAWKAQADWLAAELRLAAGDFRRVIVMGHHPCYSYSDNGPEKNVVDDILPILKEFPPSVYIGGDDHNMQVIERHGTNFIVAGCGGKTLYDVERGEGTVWAAKEFGFCVLTASRQATSIAFYDRDAEELFLRRNTAVSNG